MRRGGGPEPLIAPTGKSCQEKSPGDAAGKGVGGRGESKPLGKSDSRHFKGSWEAGRGLQAHQPDERKQTVSLKGVLSYL